MLIKIKKMDLKIKVEENQEYDKLLDTLIDLRDIQNNISELLVSQDEKIESIEDKIWNSEHEIKLGIQELQEAKRLSFSYQKVLLGGLVGAVIGGPLGFLTGLKYVGLTTSTGTILGGVGGYTIQ